jgi:hypothetical protein
MGATQNRCVNMLMLFRFIISSGIAGFWADRNFKPTVESFSFHCKCLIGSAICAAIMPALRGTALQYRTRSCSTALVCTSINPIYYGRKVAYCPPRRLVLQDRLRSFGDGRVEKLARRGSEVGPGRARGLFVASCAYRKSHPAILMVQSAQDRTTDNASRGFGGARYRRVLVQ